ncbi:hypothetical protein SCYAM73S_03819 [Streptomyces cyaneofuscatus]
MEQPRLAVGHVVAEALAAVRVLHRGDDARGLVQREEQVGLGGDGQAVDLDLVLVHIDALALLDDDLAVDLDAGLLDQLLARAARAHAGPGEDLLQPLALLLGARVGLGEVDLGLVRVPVAVALLDLGVQLTGARGAAAAPEATAAAAALCGLRAALGAAAGRRAAALAGAVLLAGLAGAGGVVADVVAALLGAGTAGALVLLVAPALVAAAPALGAPALAAGGTTALAAAASALTAGGTTSLTAGGPSALATRTAARGSGPSALAAAAASAAALAAGTAALAAAAPAAAAAAASAVPATASHQNSVLSSA